MGKLFLRGFFLIAIIGSYSPHLSANTKQIYVAIDNKYIQTYRNKTGRWILNQNYNNPKKLEELAGEFRTTVKEILDTNDNHLNRRYIFVPFGKEYLMNLLIEGYGRRIFPIDSRNFLWPVEKPDFTSRYGRRFNEQHQGLDMATPVGTPVVAAKSGVVKKTGWMGGYGLTIIIQHPDGKETLYAHLSEILVFENEEVEIGQIIALSGNTGRSTGPHLHFEVIFENIRLNPEDFLPESFFRTDVVMKEGIDGIMTLEAVPYLNTRLSGY